MIGFGVHRGYVGIRHTTGDIILIGGDHTIAQIHSSIGIIAIGGLLVEYMCDGTICNRLFNILCVVTIVMILCNAIIPMYGAIVDGLTEAWLGTFHDLYRLVMVFLFTFFAYDSAKAQLKKTDLTK